MNFDRVVTALLTIAALAIAGALVHRELDGPRADDSATRGAPTLTVEESWPSIQLAGVRIGTPSAPAQLAVFSDFECPYCQRLHMAYQAAHAEFGDSLALIFVHFPLRMHKFARPAARAAVCAGRGGRFAEYTDALFGAQDSLGLKSWGEYATAAGLSDIEGFNRCILDAKADSSVLADLALGERIGVSYTPTVVLNGWRFSEPPSEAQLASAVRAIIDGGDVASAVAKGRRDD